MYRVRLSDAQREELQRRAHEPGVMPRTRDRLEMVRLSDAGWNIPQIAVHFRLSEKCVRRWIKAFLTGSFDALPDQPHPGRHSSLTAEIEAAIRQELRRAERTWTSSQLADWVAERCGVRVTPDYLLRRLKRARISYQRTGRSVKHKQKREEVEPQQAEMAEHEKKGDAGEIDVAHRDEAGFALTLPTNYSWFPMGERLRIPYEAPQGRRVNTIGAYISHGVLSGRFDFATYGTIPASRAKTPRTTLAQRAAAHGLREEEVGPIDSERLVQFIWRFAGRPAIYPEGWKRERPLVIWLDNYSVHKSERVRQEQPLWEAAGITLCYLPSYSPEMSKIEPIWHDVKHHEITQRSHDQLGALKQTVDGALAKKATDLLAARVETAQLLRRAA